MRTRLLGAGLLVLFLLPVAAAAPLLDHAGDAAAPAEDLRAVSWRLDGDRVTVRLYVAGNVTLGHPLYGGTALIGQQSRENAGERYDFLLGDAARVVAIHRGPFSTPLPANLSANGTAVTVTFDRADAKEGWDCFIATGFSARPRQGGHERLDAAPDGYDPDTPWDTRSGRCLRPGSLVATGEPTEVDVAPPPPGTPPPAPSPPPPRDGAGNEDNAVSLPGALAILALGLAARRRRG